MITPKAMIGELTVSNIGSVSNIIKLHGDIEFFGRPYFNSDTGGFAIIPQRQRKVDVIFDREYVNQPVVNATISFNDGEDDGKDDAFLSSDTKYVVTKKSVRGFTIALNKDTPVDIRFNWTAFAIRDVKTFSPVYRQPGEMMNASQINTVSVIQSITGDNGSAANNNANSTISVLPTTDISTTTETEALPDNLISSSSPSQIIISEPLPVVVEPAIILTESIATTTDIVVDTIPTGRSFIVFL